MSEDARTAAGPWARLVSWYRSNPKHHRHLRGLFTGILVGIVMVAAHRGGRLEKYELATLDWRFEHYSPDHLGDPSLFLIQVDDESVDYIRATGQAWPPRRTVIGSVAQYCRSGGARAVVLDVTYAERSAYTIVQEESGSDAPTDDQLFADAIHGAGNVFLAATIVGTNRARPEDRDFKPPQIPFTIQVDEAARIPLNAAALALPVAPIAESAAGIGSAAVEGDIDGVKRRYLPVILVNGFPYPSLGTLVAAHLLGAKAIRVRPDFIEIGNQEVRLDADGKLELNFRGPYQNLPNPLQRPYPYTNLKLVHESIVAAARNRDLPPDQQVPVDCPAGFFADKVVFIGYSAADLGDLHNMPLIPLGKDKPGVLLHMTAVDNFLHADPIHRSQRDWVSVGVFLACVLTATLIAYFTSWGGPVAGVLLVGAAWLSIWSLFPSERIWIDLVPIVVGIVLSVMCSALVGYVFEYLDKRRVRETFSIFLAPSVVEHLARNPHLVKGGGETREMTIFFSDLAGFTSISEGMDAATLFEIMNEYLARVTEVIDKSGGTLDKYIGDAVMAFWNAPLDQSDHAMRACLAAIDSQKALGELRRRYPVLDMRVGLNSGLVKVGTMGSKERKNYTVMGDAVNLASRLEGANKNYHTHTMIGEDTFRQVAGKVVTRELDLLRVKGKAQPVRVFELLGRLNEVDERLLQVVFRYQKGLDAYRSRRWAEAIQHFQSAADLDVEDGPTQVYLERCHTYLVTPPEDDWDGVTILTTK